MKTALTALGGLVAGIAITSAAFVILGDGGSGGDAATAGDDGATADGPAPAALGPATRGGEVVVFLDHDVSDEERRGIESALDAHPEVVAYDYWDQEESLAEARRLFRGNGKMLASIDERPDLVPQSYRLDVAGTDVRSAGHVALDFEELPGVKTVTVAPAADAWGGTG